MGSEALGKRIKKIGNSHPLLGYILTMLLGTGLSQVIPFLSAPLIGRLFPPDERAFYAYFTSIAAAVATLATLRYEQAIVLAETDSEARLLTRALIRISVVSSFVVTLLAVGTASVVSKFLDAPKLYYLLPWVGVSTLASSLIMIWTYWLNRKKRYRNIASNKVEVTAVSATAQIAAPFVGFSGAEGLTAGSVGAQIIGALTLGWKARDSRISEANQLEPNTVSTKELLRRYIQMPTMNLPTALLDALRINLIPIMVGSLFGHWIAGNFSYAWMLAQAPVILISGAFSQVYYQHLVNTPSGQLRKQVGLILRRGLLIGILPFSVLALLSPWFFPFYLGDKWEMAGWMATLFTPWLYLNSVTSPVSTVFVISNRQQDSLIFAFFFMLAPVFSLWGAWKLGYGPLLALGLTSGVMAVMLMIFIVLVLRAANRYDTKTLPRKSPGKARYRSE